MGPGATSHDAHELDGALLTSRLLAPCGVIKRYHTTGPQQRAIHTLFTTEVKDKSGEYYLLITTDSSAIPP